MQKKSRKYQEESRYVLSFFAQKPLYLVGHSWGGYTVTAAAKASAAAAIVKASLFMIPTSKVTEFLEIIRRLNRQAYRDRAENFFLGVRVVFK